MSANVIEIDSAGAKFQRVEMLVEIAKQRLFLLAYEIAITISETPDADEKECDAEISTNFPYLNARITIYPCFFGRGPERQKHIVTHELAHIITQPMKAACHRLTSDKSVTWQEILDRNEAMTDWVARIAGQVDVTETVPHPDLLPRNLTTSCEVS